MISTRSSRRAVTAAVLSTLSIVAVGQIRNDSLYESIVDGRTDELLLAFDSGIGPNASLFVPNSDIAVYLLEIALGAENDAAALELLSAGASVPSVESRLGDYSLLQYMARHGMTRSILYWIDRNPTAYYEDGGASFLSAIFFGHTWTAEALLSRLKMSLPPDELQRILDEALVRAVGKKVEPTFIERLLAEGANPGSSPVLIAAVANCSPNAVDTFLRLGSNPNEVHEQTHVATYALRCFSLLGEEDARSSFARIIRSLFSAGSNVCAALAHVPKNVEEAEASIIDEAIDSLMICP